MMSNRTDLAFMDMQVEALFTHDAAGRIVSVNEPGSGPAPRFFFGRTREGNVWRVRRDLPDSVASRLESLAAGEAVTDDLRAAPRELATMLAALAALAALKETGPARVGHAGPAYRFAEGLAAPSGVTRITAANAHLLRWLPGWRDDLERGLDAYEPILAVIEDGAAVAICASVRLTDRAAEAGVETLADYRGRGYAPMVVAAWASAVRETGRTPLYSTAWDNLASQVVASKLGLIAYGSDLSLH